MTPKGKKTKAGLLLSRYLRSIAEEETELVEDQMVTKAEALSRILWKAALGGEEIRVDDQGNRTRVIMLPDLAVAKLLFERIEGKAAIVGEQEKNVNTVASKVSEQGKNRIAQAGSVNDSD